MIFQFCQSKINLAKVTWCPELVYWSVSLSDFSVVYILVPFVLMTYCLKSSPFCCHCCCDRSDNSVMHPGQCFCPDGSVHVLRWLVTIVVLWFLVKGVQNSHISVNIHLHFYTIIFFWCSVGSLVLWWSNGFVDSLCASVFQVVIVLSPGGVLVLFQFLLGFAALWWIYLSLCPGCVYMLKWAVHIIVSYYYT